MIDEIRLLAGPWGIASRGPARSPPRCGQARWTRRIPHPNARRVAALLGGDIPVTTVPGAATFGLLEIFPDALRFAAGL